MPEPSRAGPEPRAVVRRPRNRKQQILEAAGDLFRDRGYHNVSMADVAGAVGIAAPSLYRHYRNKSDLLSTVVHSGLDSVDRVVADATDVRTLLAGLAPMVVERRRLPVLWQREARHLPPADIARTRVQLNGIAAAVAALIEAERQDLSAADSELVAWAIMSVFASLSGHRIKLSRNAMESLLVDLSTRIVRCRLGSETVEPARAVESGRAEPALDVTVSRREVLLTEAIRLFDERGYQSVSIEDIGEAAGTTGPNVYNHFDAKVDLLVAAVVRGGERRGLSGMQAMARATDPARALDRLLHAHIDFASENRHLIGLLVSELDQLPDKTRRASLQNQRDYVGLWVRVLDQVRPGLGVAEAEITVRATLAVIENAARTGRLRDRADLHERLAELGSALLIGA